MNNDINLLDPSLRPRKVLLPAKQLAPALGVALLVLVGSAAWVSREAGVAERTRMQLEQRTTALTADIRELGQRIGARKASPEMQARATAREALRTAREAAMAELRAESGTAEGGHARFLRALARQSVEGLWLTEVVVSGTGHDIALRGRTLDPELVADYLRRLGREEVLHGTAFNQLEFRRPVGGEPQAGPARVLEFGVTTAAGTGGMPTLPPVESHPPDRGPDADPAPRARELAAISPRAGAQPAPAKGDVQ